MTQPAPAISEDKPIFSFKWNSDRPAEPASDHRRSEDSPWYSDVPVPPERKAADAGREARQRDNKMLAGWVVGIVIAGMFVAAPIVLEWAQATGLLAALGAVAIGWWIAESSNSRKQHRQKIEELMEEQNKILKTKGQQQ